MLRLPIFGVAAPSTVAEAVAALQTPGARVIAGGTDLLPNLKHRLDRPELLVSLSQLDELRHITRDGDTLRIGAGVTLSDVSDSDVVTSLFPSLSKAAGIVASPSIRNTATIGGNIHLDTRCRYVNQSDFWRSAIGGCLKSEGDVCYVVPGGRNCVAAMSSDTVPVLTTLDAEVVLAGPDGERRVAIAEYFNTDGTAHINKEPGELMTEVALPVPTGPRRSAYAKWTVRKNIDFPLVSVALRFDLDTDASDARIVDARVCVGVLNARPRSIRRTEILHGKRLGDESAIRGLCDLIHKQSRPLENVPYEAPYRRKMIPVYTRRVIERFLSG